MIYILTTTLKLATFIASEALEGKARGRDRPRPKGRGFCKVMQKLSWYQQGLLAIASLTPSPPKVAIPTLSSKNMMLQDSP